MTEVSNEQIQNAAMLLNNAGFNSANALQIRLDMSDEIARFQKYILGLETEIIEDKETGEIRERMIQSGEQLVNNLGFQTIMGWISFIINKHTIQGNFIDDDWYGSYMCDLHKDTYCDLMMNRKKYGIDIRQIDSIHAKFMMCTRLILTRPIGDKERLGMNNTTRIEERSVTNQGQRGLFGSGLFGGKK
jgi:hypothetical protein